MQESKVQQLVSPESAEALTLNVDERRGDDVVSGSLAAGDRRYAIESGIPRFVPTDVMDDQTVQSFAQKWEKHDYYRRHTAGFYTQWYVDRYGFETEEGLRGFLAGKKNVLDAGTGSGRDAANFARLTEEPTQVWGVDTAFISLQRASKEIGDARIGFVNADINQLPFPDEFFDVISCDQVIHHTPEPRATFANLRRKLAVGGTICCYVYRKKAVIREFVDDYVRDRVADLPIDEALEAMTGITALGKALAELDQTLELVEDIPVLGIKKGTYDLQRFVHYNIMKCFHNADFDDFTNNIVNVDWYHPRYCFRYTPDEFRAWFDEGWEIQHFDEREAGLSCRALKV
ncbi:MAG TPA: class I SAM-dependent methyltransferase [Polyangiaceae bacterium]|nr:class I SAM-dependent methyltransferase [Polyangiaceae bacterium]